MRKELRPGPGMPGENLPDAVYGRPDPGFDALAGVRPGTQHGGVRPQAVGVAQVLEQGLRRSLPVFKPASQRLHKPMRLPRASVSRRHDVPVPVMLLHNDGFYLLAGRCRRPPRQLHLEFP